MNFSMLLPSVAMVQWEALDALSHQLELCHIGPESSVVVIADPQGESSYTALIATAVARTGADSIELRPLRSPGRHRTSELVQHACGGADVVIVAAGGTDPATGLVPRPYGNRRVLVIGDYPPELHPPHANLRRRVRALRGLADAGDALVLSDRHATDLRVGLAASSISSDSGVIDDETPVARFPAGWVAVTPAAGTVNGRVVLMPGDANLGASRIIASPVVLEIIDDRVASIHGESADADVLHAQFEYPDDPNAYGIGRITVGLNPTARAGAPFDNRLLDPTLSRLLAGVVTVSFGDNLTADRPSRSSFTLALVNRDLAIDRVPVIGGGRLAGDFAPDIYEQPGR